MLSGANTISDILKPSPKPAYLVRRPYKWVELPLPKPGRITGPLVPFSKREIVISDRGLWRHLSKTYSDSLKYSQDPETAALNAYEQIFKVADFIGHATSSFYDLSQAYDLSSHSWKPAEEILEVKEARARIGELILAEESKTINSWYKEDSHPMQKRLAQIDENLPNMAAEKIVQRCEHAAWAHLFRMVAWPPHLRYIGYHPVAPKILEAVENFMPVEERI